MRSLPEELIIRIKKTGEGWVFTPHSFADLGDPVSLAVALNRLSNRKLIRRLTRGIYDYPRKHQLLGELYPSADEIAKAIADRDGIRLLPSGAYAANLLGLSEQVPAKLVFLTDGKPRKIKINKMILEFRRGAPRFMALAGTDSGVTIQALRHIGKEHLSESMVKLLQGKLSRKTKQALLTAIKVAPGWMRPRVRAICQEEI